MRYDWHNGDMKHADLMNDKDRAEWDAIACAAADAKMRRARLLNRLRQRAHVLRKFNARQDERERYGFGDIGYGCRCPGYEGYTKPDNTCPSYTPKAPRND